MDHIDTKTSEKAGLVRQLGLFDSTMMMVGIVIGSGIFLTTGIMAQSIPSPGLILLAWIVGGLLTLTGALTYAELGAAMPEAGGQYVYLREAYGHLSGFLFGWILFLVAMGGSIAALAVGFAEYAGYYFPILSTQNSIFTANFSIFHHSIQYSLSVGQIVAFVLIIVLSYFNYIGVKFGTFIQNLFTVTKIGTIVVFVIIGFILGSANVPNYASGFISTGMNFSQIVIGFGVALIAVSWAFDGWHNINYIAGEIDDPKRNLPKTLILGTLFITGLYVLVNLVYFLALPVHEMIGVVRIAEKASTSLFGDTGTKFVSAAIIISILGALNGSIFVGPRVYYAMAKDRIFFRKVAEVHPRYRTPSFAIVLQAIWSCFLTLTGTFEQLFTFVMFTTIIFWIAATSSVFRLRKKYPTLPRPYKTWGYPVVPFVFIIASVGMLITTLIEKPLESLSGIILLVIGIPVYYFWRSYSAHETHEK